MPSLKSVWIEAWRDHLPLAAGEIEGPDGERGHQVRHPVDGSVHAHVLCSGAPPFCSPDRSAKVILPALARYDNNLYIDPKYSNYYSQVLAENSDVERSIPAVIRKSAPLIEAIAQQFLVLSGTPVTAADLRTKEKKQRLLSISAELVLEGKPIHDSTDAYEFLMSAPEAPSVDALGDAMLDDDLVAELEALVGAPMGPADTSLHGLCPWVRTADVCVECDRRELLTLIDAFLAHPVLKRKLRAVEVPPIDCIDLWSEIRASVGLILDHYDSASIGLVSADRLDLRIGGGALWPAVEVPRRKQRDRDHAPLDWSLEERVHNALNDKSRRGEGLVGLPSAPDLLRLEAMRANEPLGLSTSLGRAILAAAIRLSNGFRTDPTIWNPLDTPLAVRLRRVRVRFAEESRYARWPGFRVLVEDPSTAYLRVLWQRVHGLEVRGDLAREWGQPDQVGNLLEGVMRTTLNRAWDRGTSAIAHANRALPPHPVETYVRWLANRAPMAAIADCVTKATSDPEAARQAWSDLTNTHRRPTRDGRPPTFDDLLRYYRQAGED